MAVTVSPILISGIEDVCSLDFRSLFYLWKMSSSLSWRFSPVSWLLAVWSSYAEILPFLLSIVFTAIVALANVDSEIFPPSGANFLISLSTSWQARSTTALKFLLSWSFNFKVIRRSLSSLSPLASEMKPGAASVVTNIEPGCLIGVVRDTIPDFRSSAFSDLISLVEVREVKWSISRSIYWPSRLMTSAWNERCGCLASDFVSLGTDVFGCFWMIEQV